eukprot:UN00123
MKNNKIHFLVTKSGQNLYLMTFSDSTNIYFIFYFSLITGASYL